VLGASDEVIEHVLLAGEAAGLVPRVAEIPAAAEVGHRNDAAVIEKDAREHAERGDLGLTGSPRSPG